MTDVAKSHVPHYDIYGHQHNSKPFKDSSHLLEKEAQVNHLKWFKPAPEIKSRSELLQARKGGRVPDVSYDFDRDGVVGQQDYFIGRCFDSDADGRLSTGERKRAEKALENGFLDKYMRGLDSTGQVMRGCAVKQRRGVITAADNTQDASAKTYPPHWNAHKHPDNSTRTALQLSRLAEARGAGVKAGEREFAARAPVEEPQPANAVTELRQCPFSHIRERAEADHQNSRVRAGLLPMNQPLNPEREYKTVGLERVEHPTFATRGQLLETRKEAMKRECEDLRAKGDECCVPLSVRRAEREAIEFEYRRPPAEPMTLTRLKDSRRRDKIEYDQNNFSFQRVAPRAYPKFSDQPDIPFWVSDAEFASTGTAPPRVISRTVSEPAFKVTEIPWKEEVRQTSETLPEAAHSLAAAGRASQVTLGSKTVKRWSTDLLERGQGRNQPRLFDSIQPVRIGPRDLEPLDYTSSMAPVREKALRDRAEARKQNANNPRQSQLWSPPMEAVASHTFQEAMTEALPVGRSGDWSAPVAAPSAPSRPGFRKTIVTAVMSEPSLRPAAPGFTPDMTKPREPRSFANTASVRLGQTGVRSGGFQHIDGTQLAKPLGKT